MADTNSHPQIGCALLDDNPASSQLLSTWITRQGFGPCRISKDPYEGLRELMIVAQAGQKPRFIICRLGMRSCSAIDVLQTLRRIAEWNSVPILILREEDTDTSTQAKEQQRELLASGASSFIEWPLTEANLAEVLTRAVSGPSNSVP